MTLLTFFRYFSHVYFFLPIDRFPLPVSLDVPLPADTLPSKLEHLATPSVAIPPVLFPCSGPLFPSLQIKDGFSPHPVPCCFCSHPFFPIIGPVDLVSSLVGRPVYASSCSDLFEDGPPLRYLFHPLETAVTPFITLFPLFLDPPTEDISVDLCQETEHSPAHFSFPSQRVIPTLLILSPHARHPFGLSLLGTPLSVPDPPP